ncbi:Aminotransferase [Candidatus Sulfotelmatobacter kueseliae]|uniref:alanine transaminase n=1 Tax=Candidatus Sulfotelmatobacter kueseliae TaxID=2042962 RepID=A0A2U3KRX9_9BACT|nr:Aminotransferase [Candidatus Sulfotelmatobacter kueseliae]
MFSDRTNWKLAQNRFTQAVEQARAAGAKILDLTVSNPTRVGLSYDSAATLAALASPAALDYEPQAKGLREAREAVAEYYRSDHGVRDLDPERIVLTTSTSEGYSYVFRLLSNAGDELLVPKPSYPLFEFLADLQDVKLVPYPLIYDHGWQMDFPSLETAVTARTRGVVVVHPNNPTGSYVHAEELGPLNTFCREHGLALVVDEVFLDYGLDTDAGDGNSHVGTGALARPVERSSTAFFAGSSELKPHTSFAGNRDVLTFTLSGLSKISALPQMKVAWVVTSGPEDEVAAAMARLEVIADTYLSMNAPVQWAVPVLLEQRKSIQRQLLARVRANLAELDQQLAGQKACQRLIVEGGWYAVLRVPVTRSDEELAIELVRERSVVVHPGHFYDFSSDGYLVLSLITAEGEFGEGIRKVLEELNV